MKKIICFVSIIALMACAFSQEYQTSGYTSAPKAKKEVSTKNQKQDLYNQLPARRVVFGVTFGPSINWMNWKNHNSAPKGYDRSSSGIRLGLRYGVNLDVDLTMKKNFYVSTGILIEHTGGSLNFRERLYLIDSEITRDIDRRYKSIYFTIPTAVTFRTPSFSNFIICGNIGLYHSFNLYARYQSSFQIDPLAVETVKESINHVTGPRTAKWLCSKNLPLPALGLSMSSKRISKANCISTMPNR